MHPSIRSNTAYPFRVAANSRSCSFFFYCRRAEIASRGAEIVGAASLFSLEMNEQIALDGEIVKGLVSALGSSKRNVLMAACNAVLDMSTTSVARQRLLELSALESLM